MSKKPSAKAKPFKYTATRSLPKLRSIKTEWDLKKLYYKSEKDSRIEADLQAAEAAYERFAKTWRGADFTSTAAKLKLALIDYEALAGMPVITRPGRYFSFRAALNSKDSVAQKQLNTIGQRLRKASDQILFFTLELGAIPEARQQELLNEPELAHFRYYLQRVFLGAKHHLSEAEEKIIRLKSNQAYGMWVDAVEKVISNRHVTWRRKQLPIPEALETIDVLPSADKRKLMDLILEELKEVGEFAEHEFTAIITDVRTEDELRGYEKPYSATALSYEDDEASIESLIDAVSTKGFALSKKFYKLKAAYHRVDQLDYTLKYQSIGSDVTIPFSEAVEICRDVFYGVKPLYGEIFDTMLKNGQIDAFPRAGKRGGAFMSDQTGHPTHVFLNHLSNFKSLETLAHEMGHAIHAHRSATQTPFYDGHSITTAETASTLFENLMFNAVYEQADEAQQAILLHDRITRDIATIQRQIAFFNCELEIHHTIHREGAMTNDELRQVMHKHLKSYLGPAVSVLPQDGYSYIYVPHLRYGFYVYTYAFGILMSNLMAKRYQEDNSYVNEIDRFLTAGASDTVANIFAAIGIDTRAPDTFLQALKQQEADVRAFERVVKARK